MQEEVLILGDKFVLQQVTGWTSTHATEGYSIKTVYTACYMYLHIQICITYMYMYYCLESNCWRNFYVYSILHL